MKQFTYYASFLGLFVLLSSPVKALDHVIGTPDGFVTSNYQLTGGSGGAIADVYTASELADALDTEGKIIVRVHGEIRISSELSCRSHKTIVGVGDNAVIRGQGIALNKRENVIFQNIHFMQSGDDLIKLNNTQHVWIDHCSFSDGGADPSSSDFDGTLDICKGSDLITVSYCHFFNHSKNILMSSSDGSGNSDRDKLRTTFHHNYFDGTYQRNPSVRFGIVHLYNNYFAGNTIYSIASREGAKVLVEDNYFKDCAHPGYGKSGYADSGPGFLWTRGTNIFDNSNEAEFNSELNAPPANPSVSYTPEDYYPYTSVDAGGIPAIVVQQAGAGKLGEEGQTGVQTVCSGKGKVVSETIYSVSGIPVKTGFPQGVLIKKTVYENGDCQTAKFRHVY
ncbi:MAG: hypothetical protein LBH61_03670 [Dysgonamonadaceae bacterium]|jgi:pectate lyase|nr:hypothetical protein [Dysgonamonadaceae bacterium]